MKRDFPATAYGLHPKPRTAAAADKAERLHVVHHVGKGHTSRTCPLCPAPRRITLADEDIVALEQRVRAVEAADGASPQFRDRVAALTKFVGDLLGTGSDDGRPRSGA